MLYNINYILTENILTENILTENNSELTIYDFGSIKGFLFNNNFIMYKIINKENKIDICEPYNGPIPLKTISIETYNCIFDNGYKTPEFTIIIEEKPQLQGHLKKEEPVVTQQPHLLYSQPLLHPPQPSQQQRKQQYFQKQPQVHPPREALKQPPILQLEEEQLPSPLPPLHQQQNKRNSSQQREVQINEKYKKTQQGVLYSQQPLDLPNAGLQQKYQWMSLEEVMKGLSIPLPGVGQAPHSQPVVKVQNSVALSQKATQHSLRVRRVQQRPVIQHRETTC